MDTALNIEQLTDELNAALLAWNSDLSASEFHGALCGLIATGSLADAKSVASKVSVIVGAEIGAQSSEHQALLTQLFETASEQLDTDTFNLMPLVNEDTPGERLSDLAHWAQGFLLGIGYAEGDVTSSADTQQALQDLVAISQVATDEESIDSSDLEEVFEYTRMTAHLIFLEAHSKQSAKVSGPPLQ